MRRVSVKPCPECGKLPNVYRIMFSGSIFDKHLFFVECPNCHYCGKTKLFWRRAVKAWNRRKDDDRA